MALNHCATREASLYEFLCATELKFTDNVKCDITKHLSELGAQLCKYFPETDDTNNWIHYPFHALPQNQNCKRGSVKIQFNQKLLSDFWIGLRSRYPALANCTVKTLMPFATTYLCESGFSALTSMKTKYRHRLCVEKDLRLRLSPI